MTVDTQAASLAEAGDYEQVVKEDPRDVTPADEQKPRQSAADILAGYHPEEDKPVKKSSKKSTAKKDVIPKNEVAKGGDDENGQEELFSDGTITPTSADK